MASETIYAHIDDGCTLTFSHETWQLIASNSKESTAIRIGALGLVDLGRDLIRLGMRLSPEAIEKDVR